MLLAKIVTSDETQEAVRQEVDKVGNDMIIVYTERRMYPEYVIRYIWFFAY